MDENMPPYRDGSTGDVTRQVCDLVDAEGLDQIVGIRIGDHAVSKDYVVGAADIEDNSPMWTIPRAKMFSWAQSITIIIQPNDDCSAQVRYYPFPD
jgi:hypothetical protein